jgi:pimeloyl-ACP methyl ester carboxylesterase
MNITQLKEEYHNTRLQLFKAFDIRPESNVIRTSGPVKDVHYLRIGRGEPLILMHGGGSHSSEWMNILKPLSEHYQVYALDAPGYGMNAPFDYRHVDYQKNTIEYLRSVLDALKLNRVFFAGNSIGGYYGIQIALYDPDRIKTLVLVGAPAGTHRHIPLPLRLMGTRGVNTLLMSTVARPSMHGTRSFHDQLLMADANKLSSTYIRHTICHMRLTAKTLRSMLERVTTLRGWREDLYIGDQLRELTVPVRCIWGDQDKFESSQRGRRTHSIIPDLNFQIIENAGHCPWLDQPDRCSEMILAILQKSGPPVRTAVGGI